MRFWLYAKVKPIEFQGKLNEEYERKQRKMIQKCLAREIEIMHLPLSQSGEP